MAINVNTVYQTVLLILNKEQRGYMTPVEFNRTGTQSQLEIFESYFESLNQQIRIPQTDTDYADRVVNLDEKISIFKEFGSATSISTSNVFNLPQQFSGSAPILGSVTVPALTTAATLPYTIQTVTADEISNGIVQVFGNGILLDETQYTVSGTVITFNFQPTIGQTLIVNVYPKQFYRLGNLFYAAGALDTQELERVTRSELFHLNSSNLTKPSTTYPVYTYEANKITVYPLSIINGINVSYIRKPIPPIWNFSVTNSAYIYSAASSFNFELHASDQTELILRILLYAGVVIKNREIIEVASSQIQQEQNNQKS